MFLKKLFKVVPRDPLAQGLDLFNNGRSGEALEIFESLLEDPEEAVRQKARLYACEAHLQLGDAGASRDLQGAVYHYGKASDYQPRFADIHNKLGEVCRRLGRLEEAAEAFGRAVAINERYFLAHLNLVQVLLEMGRLSRCGDEVERLLACAPPLLRERCEALGAACRAADRQRMQEILAEIRHLDPDRVSLARDRALQLLRKGEAARSAEILEELVERNPRFPDLRHILGLAYGELDRPEEAMACFREALAINPHYLKARINLAFCLMEKDEIGEARSELERALETDPDHPLAKSALAELNAMGTRS
jgi:tetratricopeptide (TPR) repeat protein